MANEQDRNQNPATGTEADISKAQSQQKPLPQGDTLAQQRTEEPGESESGFVGAEGQRDTSSELVEEEKSEEEGRKTSDAE